MARMKGSAKLLEERRRQALMLLSEGRSLREVAGVINCAASSVLRWQQAWERGGEQALRVRSSPGRPQKLKTGQRRKLLGLLRKGARANGYSTDTWTTARIAEVIKLHFGVTYHRDHIGRLMRSLGWIHVETRAEESEFVKGIKCSRICKTLQGWIPASASTVGCRR
jgi:transposase